MSVLCQTEREQLAAALSQLETLPRKLSGQLADFTEMLVELLEERHAARVHGSVNFIARQLRIEARRMRELAGEDQIGRR